MKKLFLTLMMTVGTMAAHADDYPYLIFETTDGAKTAVSVASLTMTVSGTTLTAGEQTFNITNLSKMYFSTTDNPTAVQQVNAETLSEAEDIYDLRGMKVSREQMRQGVYIIKTKQGTHKIVVR